HAGRLPALRPLGRLLMLGQHLRSGSGLRVAGEGGTIAIQATTMPPCRRSPDELLCVPVEEAPENIASLTRTQRTRVPPATTPTRACSSAGQSASLTTTNRRHFSHKR